MPPNRIYTPIDETSNRTLILDSPIIVGRKSL